MRRRTRGLVALAVVLAIAGCAIAAPEASHATVTAGGDVFVGV